MNIRTILFLLVAAAVALPLSAQERRPRFLRNRNIACSAGGNNNFPDPIGRWNLSYDSDFSVFVIVKFNCFL